MRARRQRQRGMALLLALAATAIISALLGGIMLLSASHLGLSHVNSCYASAMNVAEAGVNWELWKISHNPAAADQTPVTVEYPSGSGRTFTVRVEAFPGGGAWTPPGQLRVTSTGTVDHTSRTVRVLAGGRSVAGEYALFGINSITIGGSATVEGAMGTNGQTTIHSTLPTGMDLDGDFWYCGNNAGGADADPYLQEGYHSQDASLPEHFSTVNEIANKRALDHYGVTTTEGVDFFRGTNNNAGIANINGGAVPLKPYTLDHNDINNLIKNGSLPVDADGNAWIVFGPGDYYFEYVDLTSQDRIRIDSAAGEVNIWLGPSGGTAGHNRDTVNGQGLAFTGHDVTQFHLYEGSRRELRMNGTMDFYGMIQAYNGPDASGKYYGSVVLNGNGVISGGVIAWDVQQAQGDLTVIFPSGGGSDDSVMDPSLFYQYRSWEEVNPL